MSGKRRICSLYSSKDRRKETKDFVQRLRHGEAVEPFKTQRVTQEGRILGVWLTASLLVDERDTPRLIATTEREMGKR